MYCLEILCFQTMPSVTRNKGKRATPFAPVSETPATSFLVNEARDPRVGVYDAARDPRAGVYDAARDPRAGAYDATRDPRVGAYDAAWELRVGPSSYDAARDPRTGPSSFTAAPSVTRLPDAGQVIKGTARADEIEGTFAVRSGLHPLHDVCITGQFVDREIRERQATGEFVNLYSLLPAANRPVVIARRTEAGGRVIPEHSEVPLTFVQWRKAFNTYMANFLAYHPEAGPQLCTYVERVTGLQEDFPGTSLWSEYDEAFRMLKAHQPHLPWTEIH